MIHDNFKELIKKLLPDTKEREDFFACYHEILPRSIKIIEHKLTSDAFTQYINRLGRKLTPPPFVGNNDSWYIERAENEIALGKHFLHTAGFFYIQEVAASLAVHVLNIAPGDIVLDMCAAPGGKSTQIADKLLVLDPSNPGCVVSNEVSGSRIIALQSNLNRTGVYNTAVTKLDGTQFGSIIPEFFDKVLVDAPCSGEGTGFKSDASTKRWREENVQQIAKLQYSLLVSAIKACKPGGEIVYATCTLNPWENEGVIAKALTEYADFIALENVDIANKSPGSNSALLDYSLSDEQLNKLARFWPHRQHTGGFFIAKLIKIQSTDTPIKNKKGEMKNKSAYDMSEKLQTQIAQQLAEDYGIIIDTSKHFFVGTNKQIYLTTPAYKELHNLLYVEKTGIPIFKRYSDTELHPLHGLGNCFGPLAIKNVVSLTDEECQKYSDGADLDYSNTQSAITTKHKYAILQRQGKGFSVGKVVGDTIKNKFAK